MATRRATSSCARSRAGSSGRRAPPTSSPAHGGDEFLVLAADLPADGSPGAREIAHTIADHIAQALSVPATVDGTTITAGGSVGIALYPEDAGSRDELLRRADAAMYRSKELARRSAG